MEFGLKISFIVLFFSAISANAVSGSQKCSYPAIFNFGDSNSDTGGANELYRDLLWPYGFSAPSQLKGRASDGRLIIDFIAEKLGLPYLNSTLNKNGTTYKYGANFAVGGQRINHYSMPGTMFWYYNLDQQVTAFLALKSQAATASPNINYPDPEVFKNALYTIDIGQNDVGSTFTIPQVGEDFISSVKRLLDSGAKYLWIHNTCPFGCLPKAIQDCPNYLQPTCTPDKYGCLNENNLKSQQLNAELEKRVKQLRTQYPEAVITLVDMYSAKYNLLNHIQGFDDSAKLKQCCGQKGVSCGHPSIPSKENNWTTAFGGACKDPSKFLSWDGVHYTEAANKYIANQIISGLYTSPSVTLAESCIKQ